MASNPLRGGQWLGFVPFASGPGANTLALSAAATWLAYGYTPSFPGGTTTKTNNGVRAFVSAVNGTLANTDLSCDIYSDTNGVPNVSLGSTTTLTAAAPTGAAWVEWSGLSVVVTTGVQYWIVIKNLNAVPATNFPTFRFTNQGLPWLLAQSNNSANWGWVKKHTTNSGGAWGTAAQAVSGFRVGYSDSSYDGFPSSNAGAGTDKAFGSTEAGVKFTTPPNGVLNVSGLAFLAQSAGSPTGNLRFRLYNNTTLLATTIGVIKPGNVTGGGWYFGYFATQVIQPGTVLRASISNDAADDASNYFRSSGEYTIDTDANSLPLMPFEGTLQRSGLSGGTWTDTNSNILPFALLLDSTGEFGAGGGAGGGSILRSGIIEGVIAA